ncbi:D-alanyl-D-alanine carboxypeptidase family protein [Pseudomonadota bacterium]
MTFIFSFFKKRRYLHRVSRLNEALGMMNDHLEKRGLPVQMEANHLVSIGLDIYQREQRMLPGAAQAWRSMVESAAGNGITLQAVSAYRSVDYQAGIIRRKLDKGQNVGDILRVSAAPGYSEHHTGRAIDVTTPGAPVLEEAFEETEAFRWLTEHAADFGFSMSFPRGNPHGVAYEPWHWAWKG